MVKRKVTAKARFHKLLRQEMSAIRRHDFKKARLLNERGGKLITKLQRHHKIKREY